MKKILLVEDSELYYNFLVDVIKDVEISRAKDGEEAIETYQREMPSLVLVDIILPDMSGIDVIKRIKEIDGKANIIAISGMDKKDIVRDAKKAGARDYIVKDLNVKSLREKILKNLY